MMQGGERTGNGLRGLVPLDLTYFRWLEEIDVSPDGKHVAYTVRRVDVASNGYVVDVFVQALDVSGSERKLTAGGGIASSVAWSPDSQRLAFSYAEKNTSVIVTVGLDGSRREYPMAAGSASGLTWSPDGSALACVRWTQVDRGNEPTYGDPWPLSPDLRVITRRVYKLNGVGFIHDKVRHVWTLHLPTGEWSQLTDGEHDYLQPRFSHDGRRIAFIRSDREETADLGDGELLVYELSDGSMSAPLADWGGKAQSIAWSPDDETLVFVGHDASSPSTRRTYSTVFRYRFSDSSVVDLVPDSTDVIGNYAVADQRKGLTNHTVRWPPGGGEVEFLLTEQGGVNLYRVDVDTGRRTRLAGDRSVVFEFSSAGDRVLFGESTTTNPGDLWLLEGSTKRRLTNLNPWLAFRALSTPEEYWYDGLDGAKVHAWMMRPLNADLTGTHPLILQVHCSMFSYDFNFENQIMAQAGYAVAYFNQRGTTAGYGEAWTAATVGNDDDVDYQEIMLGLDDLLSRFDFIDEDRMGVTGGSCGGILTNWIIGHTDRFRAAVTQRSIVNYISQHGAADIGVAHLRGELKATPWSDLERVWRKSGLAYAEKVSTPLLIIQSDQDHRCPIEQAEEYFVALRLMGKEVEFCWFEGESHDLSRSGKPNNRVERLRRIVGWFDRHLQRRGTSGVRA